MCGLPVPFPLLLHKRASRWLGKYFGLEISLATVESILSLLYHCTLIIRTLGYAWTTGARFSHGVSDTSKCPFCKVGSENLPHIISCPSLIIPILVASNSVLRSRGLLFQADVHINRDPYSILSVLLPQPCINVAQLFPLAAVCDVFQASKGFSFSNDLVCQRFIFNRVSLFADRLSKDLRKNIEGFKRRFERSEGFQSAQAATTLNFRLLSI